MRINRPEAHNALNSEVLRGLRQAIVPAGDEGVRAVIVTGTGTKAFCAGADLKELAGHDPASAYAVLVEGQSVMRSIETAGVPVIAAVNGLALGGGFELMLASTFTVVADHASMALPEAGLGLIPGYGGTQRLARVIGRASAAYLMLTGERVNAMRAHELRLTPVPPVPGDRLLSDAMALAERVADCGPLAIRSILTALDLGPDAPLGSALALESGLAAIAVTGREGTEGVAAFLAKRPPVFAREVRT
ncbi:enoyl-CoA hydratase/isomerase family protein [Streptomyces sp. NPDC091219]|uniref:enoyl-CoA hydratase/isomerase family protein n=1 Tax=Streptomyces sp. NPDC091219 TaxID=3155193 RepID=UPI0034510370